MTDACERGHPLITQETATQVIVAVRNSICRINVHLYNFYEMSFVFLFKKLTIIKILQ